MLSDHVEVGRRVLGCYGGCRCREVKETSGFDVGFNRCGNWDDPRRLCGERRGYDDTRHVNEDRTTAPPGKHAALREEICERFGKDKLIPGTFLRF